MRLLLKLGCAGMALALVVGIGAAGALPLYMDLSVGRESEVTHLVGQLRQLEIDHESWNGAYQEVPKPFPRPKHAVDGYSSYYSWDNNELSMLGFHPEESELYGVYWVDTSPGDFTVHGLIEIEGDLRHYTATRSVSVERAW